MRSILRWLLIVTCGAALFGCASATRQNTASMRPARLQLTVGLPASMSALRDEEVAEAFAYRVISILKEQGFRGRIRYVDTGDAPNPETPTLAVELREWRVNHSGFVDCTFTAELNTPAGNRRLGIFSGTSLMTWSRRDWFARAEGFEDSARDAISDLVPRLEQSGLIDRAGSR